MPFLLVRDDITKVRVDAVVNPANPCLKEGQGTSRAVFQAAGRELLQKACEKAGRCDMGKAVITEGFGLPAKYVIHAVGPMWQGGGQGEDGILYSAYMESMKLARKWRLESMAFPLLSSGSYGYPKERALAIAVSAISDFLMENEMMIYLVVYDARSLAVSWKLFASIEEYIDEHYIQEKNHIRESGEGEERFDNRSGRIFEEKSQIPPASKPDRARFPRSLFGRKRREETSAPLPAALPPSERQTPLFPPAGQARPLLPRSSPPPQAAVRPSAAFSQARPEEKTRMLEDIMLHMGETFSQMLLRLIDERGLPDPEVYHKANIDRKLFSKIRTNIHYSPNKKTVLSFAIALELSLDETKDLLRTAGYSLSDSSRFDVIISFFLEHGIYDIFEINEMLFYYEQPLLG